MEYHIVRVDPKNEDQSSLLFQMYAFRYQYYCKVNPWVKEPFSNLALEVDPFDPYVLYHYGVMNSEGKIVAYQRIIHGDRPWMFEYAAYNDVTQGVQVSKNLRSAEVSRLAVDKSLEGMTISDAFPNHNLVAMIYRENYRICQEMGIENVYFATTKETIRKGKIRGFPLELIKESQLESKEYIQLVRLNWERFFEFNRKKRPEMVDWYLEPRVQLPLAVGQ